MSKLYRITNTKTKEEWFGHADSVLAKIDAFSTYMIKPISYINFDKNSYTLETCITFKLYVSYHIDELTHERILVESDIFEITEVSNIV